MKKTGNEEKLVVNLTKYLPECSVAACKEDDRIHCSEEAAPAPC